MQVKYSFSILCCLICAKRRSQITMRMSNELTFRYLQGQIAVKE